MIQWALEPGINLGGGRVFGRLLEYNVTPDGECEQNGNLTIIKLRYVECFKRRRKKIFTKTKCQFVINPSNFPGFPVQVRTMAGTFSDKRT